MVVLDGDAVLGSEAFECQFCLDGLVRREVLHQMDVAEAGEMIHEDGGCAVTLASELSLHLSEETLLRRYHVVDAHAFSGFCCHEDLVR